jgi:CheY-like chemotaxis protein
VADEVRASTRATDDAQPLDLSGKRVLIVDDNRNNRLILRLQTERWGMLKLSHLRDRLLETVDQPRERTTAASEPARQPGDGEAAPLRILLAEDNELNQKVALRLLERLGYRADIASTGREALARLERAVYDVVLMDVQMPELDGLEASRATCGRWPAGERPRIVAMTAEAMQGDREKCLAAGMDDYMVKPVTLEQLGLALAKCRPRRDSGADHGRSAAPSPATPWPGSPPSRSRTGGSKEP